MDGPPTRLPCPQDSPGKNSGAGCHFLLQQRQLVTSIIHLVQKLLVNIQCSSSSRSFAKDPRALKTRSVVISHWKLTVMNWRPSLKLILLQLLGKLLKKSVSTFYSHSTFEANWKGKKLDKWVPCELAEKKKFWNIFSYSTQQQQTFFDHIVTCDDNQQWPALWLDWEAPKHFPKPNLYQKKKKGHGHCLMVCCPSDPLQLSESWQNHYL